MIKKIEICLDVIRETEKAYQVSDDDKETLNWIPKSQVETEQECGPGDTVVFIMPEWLAIDKGFI